MSGNPDKDKYVDGGMGEKDKYMTKVFQLLGRKVLSVRDGIGKVRIEMENKARGKQVNEQGVRGHPDKDEYVAGGKEE